MKDIIIVCAGGYGSEIYVELCNLNRYAERNNLDIPYNILGFIDDTQNPLAVERHHVPVIGGIQTWEPKSNERFVIGISNPKHKEEITRVLKSRGALFETIVAKNTFVPDDVILGEGCIINNATIGCGVRLGDFVTISGSMLYGGAEIGDFSTTTGFSIVEKAQVGKKVFIGSKAVITEGCYVGDEARVSAGAVVIDDIKEKALVFGVPAKVVG